MPSVVFTFGTLILEVLWFDLKRESERLKVASGLLLWKNRLGRLA